MAIIAVITIPIILGVIDNAKRGSVIDSAYGYKDAVQKFYVEKLSEDINFKLNGWYTVEDGKLVLDTEELDIQVSGTKPTSGTLVYEDNVLKSGCLTFDDNYVLIEKEQIKDSKKGACQNISGTVKDDGRKYFSNAMEINFDPTGTITNCTEKDYEDNDDKLGNSGCMKWYAYSENTDGTVNMLLDHNIGDTFEWVSEADYKGTGSNIPSSVGLTYPKAITEENPLGIVGEDKWDYDSKNGNWNKGPITLLGRLKFETRNWESNLISRSSYGTYINKNKFYDNSNINNPNYTISYYNESDMSKTYNARIITVQEVAYITSNSWDERTATSSFGFDSTNYSWLKNTYDGIYGYWTVSSDTSDSSYVWSVSRNGYVFKYTVSGLYDSALRPIITVSKSVVYGS